MAKQDIIIDDPPMDLLEGGFVTKSNPPLVSFCIPTYNNESTIKACLSSYRNQNYQNIEIVVVDNGSTDRTVEIARQYADTIKFDDGGIGSVRKTSVEAANGEILGLFDSDIVLPHEGWLHNAVQYFNYSDEVSTVWPENVAPPDSPPTTQVYFRLWHAIEEDRIETGRGPFGGGNSLFRREALEDVGGIDQSLHYVEDMDWAKRLQEAGYQVVYLRDPVYHYTMLGFGTFFKKQFMAADRFTRAGSEVTGLPVKTIIYEQAVIGTIGMIRGLIQHHDPIWLLFPALLIARAVAFAYTLANIGAEKFISILGRII